MFRLCLAAVSLTLAAGPTRIGLMMPASAASTAPRSELSSQGWTTRVGTAGTFCAAAIRRSYFDRVGVPLASAVMTLIASLRILAVGPLTPGFSDRKRPYCPDHRAQIIRLPDSVVLRPRRISLRLPTARP